MRQPLSIAIALVVLSSPAAASAQSVVLRHTTSMYNDLKTVRLAKPEGVGCSATSLVVADTGNGRLVRYAVRDGVVTGGTEVKVAQVPYPVRVQLDSKGNIFVLDGRKRGIFRLDPNGAFLGAVELKGANVAGVVPGAFKLDDRDNLYVLDLAGARVLVADATGAVSRQIEYPKKTSFSDIAVDAAGAVFATEGASASLWAAEKGATAFKQVAANLKDRMNFPVNVVASRGRLYVADQHGNGIVLLAPDGSFLGRQLAIGWSDGLVYYPTQLCVSGREIYVADRGNNRVQQFTAAE